MSSEISKGPVTPSGSYVNHIPGRRSVKEYAVSEETLDSMGTASTSSSIYLTIASVAAGYAGSIYLSIFTATSLLPESNAIRLELMMNFSIIISVIFFFLAAISIFKQKGIIKRIKRETIHDEK